MSVPCSWLVIAAVCGLVGAWAWLMVWLVQRGLALRRWQRHHRVRQAELALKQRDLSALQDTVFAQLDERDARRRVRGIGAPLRENDNLRLLRGK